MQRFPRLGELAADTWPAIVEANAVDGCRQWAEWPLFEVREERGVIATRSPTGFALFNNILRSRVDEDELPQRVESVLEPYRREGVPLLWWTGPVTRPALTGQHLASLGFSPLGKTFGMIADLNRIERDEPLPVGVQILEVENSRQMHQWCGVMTSVYSFPEFAVPLWHDLHAALGFGMHRSWRHFLATFEGEPAATVSLFAAEDSAAVANVATLPALRRRGLGRAVTLAALDQARRVGYQVGTLFSSPEAAGVYRTLGFEKVCEAECYCWSPE